MTYPHLAFPCRPAPLQDDVEVGLKLGVEKGGREKEREGGVKGSLNKWIKEEKGVRRSVKGTERG